MPMSQESEPASTMTRSRRLIRSSVRIVCICVAVPLILLVAMLVLEWIPRSRVAPPESVTDIASCLNWLEEPRGAYRITSGQAVYYQILGPPGRYLASGPSGYTFDSTGHFIGWSADIGDYRTPPEVLAPDAKREPVALDELRQGLYAEGTHP